MIHLHLELDYSVSVVCRRNAFNQNTSNINRVKRERERKEEEQEAEEERKEEEQKEEEERKEEEEKKEKEERKEEKKEKKKEKEERKQEKWSSFDRPIVLKGKDTVWRGFPSLPVTLVLSSSVPSNVCESFVPFTGGLRIKQLLLSALQKSVRRGNAKLARECAKTLIRTDLQTFLRRLPIIIAEDAVCEPHLLLSVWCMCATTRGFLLNATLRDLLVEMCARAARSPIIERLRSTLPSSPWLSEIFNDPSFISIALLIRASYGGMEGDIAMLCDLAQRWYLRRSLSAAGFSLNGALEAWSDVVSSCVQHSPAWFESINLLRFASQVPNEAFDFHVYRDVYFQTFQKEKERSMVVSKVKKAELERALWLHRSGVYASWKCYWTSFDNVLVINKCPFNECARRRAELAATEHVWKEVEPIVRRMDEYFKRN